MKKRMKALTTSILWSLKFGAILTLILLALSLFTKGTEFFKNYSLPDLLEDFSFNTSLFLIVSLTSFLFSYITIGKASSNLTPQPLSNSQKH